MTYIKKSLNILQLSIVSFHWNHCFYEPTDANLSLNQIQTSFNIYYKHKVFLQNELFYVLSDYWLMKMLLSILRNHIHKASFCHEPFDAFGKKNAVQKKMSIADICKAAHLCESSNARLKIFCKRILSYNH